MFKKKSGGLDTVFTRKARESKGVKSEGRGSPIITPEERVRKAHLAMEERIAQRNAGLTIRQDERELQAEEFLSNAAEVEGALVHGDVEAAIEINARISVPKVK